MKNHKQFRVALIAMNADKKTTLESLETDSRYSAIRIFAQYIDQYADSECYIISLDEYDRDKSDYYSVMIQQFKRR